MLTQVRNILNTTLIIRRESEKHDIGFRYLENKTKIPHKAFDHFLNKSSFDIFFTALRAKPGSNNMDNLFLHERDDYVMVVPAADKIPEYYYIFLTMTFTMWLSTSICMYIMMCKLIFNSL